jgi:DNA-directed RNA polymerase subunit RPC12/RpoP
MKEHGLRPQAIRPLLRKGVYVMLVVMCGTIGILLAREGMRDKRVDFVVIGIALPFIFAGGEYIRNRLYFKKFQTARCKKCGNDFPFGKLLEIGRCPECRSKRIVGLRPE